MPSPTRRGLTALALAAPLALAACSSTTAAGPGRSASPSVSSPGGTSSASPRPTATATSAAPSPAPGALPGMPPLLQADDVYAARRVGMLSPAVRGDLTRVYVPNTISGTVSVIDPATMKVVDTFATGRIPQHVVPSYDLSTLWVNNNQSNTLTPIDPKTGKRGGKDIPVDAPYNLYFTPDGKSAMVMAERLRKIDFRDPKTMALQQSLPVPECKGVNHADFSSDGTYFLASCEFAKKILKVSVLDHKVLGTLDLTRGGMPQDVRLSPDGSVFFVADMDADGVHVIDGVTLTETGFIPTGKNAHGIYFSRDSKQMYVSNRGEGSVSVVDVKTRQVTAKWQIPGGGSPDMGGVSADGKVLWLSGRYDSVVYALDTTSGALLAKIGVGKGPHGLAFFPQPGRYSLGHTGVFR